MRGGNGNWEKLEELFHELTQLTEPEKISRLAAISKESIGLFEQLSALLEADKTSHPLFQVESGGIFSLLASDQELLGSRIGAFELREIIGQGAMGTVFKGHRADGQFDQVVAIKLMKPLLINPSFRDYFERERQILAKLNHPNIARLYDGGFTEDGRPFFTMEWISGNNLIDYCKHKKLGLNACLNLFGQVCRAVRYAHQSLIAHLDLKPQNIIINDEGQVKLLDFGVSQMVEEGFDKESGFTLAYAAPEQIERNNPSTVSDIYALGVILFELLNEYHPYGRLFKDTQGLKEAILRGNATTFKLSGIFGKVRFSNDLELICRKAMEVLSQHRYASVVELERDLNDFRNDYPITAHAKTWTYQAQKYLQRNRTVLVVANSAFLILLAMGIYYTFQLREQRNIALAEAKRANQITNLITDVFSAADPNIGGADTITAVQLLDEGLKNLEKNLGDDPELYADMLLRLGGVYLSLGQYEKGKKAIGESYVINMSLDDISPQTLANNEVLISSSFLMYGEMDSSIFYSQKAVDRLREAGIVSGEYLSNALLELGGGLYDMSKYKRADSVLTVGLEISRNAHEAPHIEIATFLHMKGATARKLKDLEAAEKYLIESLGMKRQLFNEPHLEIAYAYNHFGSFYQSSGDYEKALTYVRSSLEQREAILGRYHVETVASLGNLARTFIGLGKPEEAIPLYKTAIAVVDSIFGKTHHYYGTLNGSLGNAYYEAGDLTNSREFFEVSVKLYDELLSDNDPRKANPRVNLGKIAMDEGRYEDAKSLFSESLQIRKELLSEGDIQIAQSQQALGESLLAMGDFSTAIDYFEEALLAFQTDSMSNVDRVSKINRLLAETYSQIGDQEKASFYAAMVSAAD